MTAAAIGRVLISILVLLFGIAVAITGSYMGGPLVVVGGVALIILGARLLRPISPEILRWLNDKDV